MRNNKGRSLISSTEMKCQYIEFKAKQWLKNGRIASHVEIVNEDFGLTMTNFMNCEAKVIMNKVRVYVYKMRGKYGNNKMV